MSLPTIHPPAPLLLTPEPLTPSSFAPFGTVITAPLPSLTTSFPATIPNALYPAYQPLPVPANQSTALKTSPISPLVNNYDTAKSGTTKGSGLMSIFSSFPRRNVYLSSRGSDNEPRPTLKLGILERHPYTTQTFCPFNYSTPYTPTSPSQSTLSPIKTPTSQQTLHTQPQPQPQSPPPPKTYILIIVAPTLPAPSTTPPNPPDLSRVRAFIHPLNSTDPDHSNVAVTYNPGTWHAPMIVLGSQRVDFLVTQFANGVAQDDCQEVLVGSGPDEAVLRGDEMRKSGGDGKREVEVDLSGWGVEVQGEEGDGSGSGSGEGRPGRASKL